MFLFGRRSGRIYLVLSCLFLFAACASPTRVGQMASLDDPNVHVAKASSLKKAIIITEVTGGQETNPMWTSQVSNPDFQRALEHSLLKFEYISLDQGKYSLTVTLLSLDQPFFGVDFEVKTSVRYILKKIQTNEVVLDQTISSAYTASFSQSFYAVERLRIANEGSVRNNIHSFLVMLSEKSNALIAVPKKNDDNISTVDTTS
jgi:hypothetical protein